MPLSGEAKKAYQREYMRKRRTNEGLTAGTIRPKREASVIPKIPKLVMEGNVIVGIHPDLSRAKLRERSRGINRNDSDIPPICTKDNFRQFKVGDVVRVWQGKRMIEVEIPELDDDGNPI